MNEVWILKNKVQPNSFSLYAKTIPNKDIVKAKHWTIEAKKHIPVIWSFTNQIDAIKFIRYDIHRKKLIDFQIQGTHGDFTFEKMTNYKNTLPLYEFAEPIELMESVREEDNSTVLTEMVLSTQCEFCVVQVIEEDEFILSIQGIMIKPFEHLDHTNEADRAEQMLSFLEHNLNGVK